MPSDLFRRDVNLDYLYPPFLEALLSLLTECRMLGTDYKVYSGYRSNAEQLVLYDKYLKGGAKAAPVGLSAHNYGLAIDCARLLPNKTLTWEGKEYSLLEETAPKHGLVTGKAFGDRPHVQWPGYVNGRELLPLKIVYNKATGTELERLKIAVWPTIK